MGLRLLGRVGALTFLAAAGLGAALQATGAEATHPGTNGKIAYAWGNHQIYVADADGGNPTLAGSGSGNSEPAWSPDGRTLVYESSRDGDYELYLWTPSGGETKLTDNGVDDRRPSFSADGLKLAFDSGGQIHTMRAVAGAAATQLTSAGGTDAEWSPDGLWIAYRRASDIWVVYADGAAPAPPEQLTTDGAFSDDSDPSFAPDSSELVFARYSSGVSSIARVPVRGGTVTTVLSTDAADPEWSPDGSTIVYRQSSTGDLRTVAPNGSGDALLVADANALFAPAWAPAVASGSTSTVFSTVTITQTATTGGPTTTQTQTVTLPITTSIVTTPVTTTIITTPPPPPPAEGTFYVDGRECTIVGSNGTDTLRGTPGPDVICGLDGDDTIRGLDGNDLIAGGNGADEILGGGGDDIAHGGHGRDELEGGTGADRLQGGLEYDQVLGNDGNDTLYGGADRDAVFGQEGHDSVYGGGGNDDLRGMAGDDLLVGDAGDDLLQDWEGSDRLFGGPGNDLLFDREGGTQEYDGGSGNDKILAGPGDDVLRGGEGHDEISAANGHDQVFGGPGNDTLWAGYRDDEDLVAGEAGDDRLVTITLHNRDRVGNVRRFGDRDTVDGGPGADCGFVDRDGHDVLFGLESARDDLHDGHYLARQDLERHYPYHDEFWVRHVRPVCAPTAP